MASHTPGRKRKVEETCPCQTEGASSKDQAQLVNGKVRTTGLNAVLFPGCVKCYRAG